MHHNLEYPEIPPYLDNESDLYEELPVIEDSALRSNNVKL